MALCAKPSIFFALALLSAPSLFGGLVSSTPSISEYATGSEQLVVYTDVPGHAAQAPMVTVKPGINPQNQIPLKLKSDVFEIRVKSAATDGQWVQCFTNYTYNRGSEIEDIDKTDGTNSPVVIQNYQNLTSGWSHSYANLEMTPNSPVDVEITLIGSTQLNGKNFVEKFAVHPFDKATNLSLTGGKIYFTINQPSQVVIDINGQMDDHNAAVNPMAGNPPAHGITLFANPILAKPAASGPGIISMAPGDAAPDPAAFSTLVFQPGVHEIGLSFPLHPGKSYYIPGDAVLIGTFSNLLSSKGSYRTKGDSIRMYGYGMISGATYTHFLYPGYIQGPTTFSDRAIVIEEGVSCELFGLAIADPANHSTRFFAWSGSDQASDTSYTRWMKPITWRANGDGIGGGTDLEDCFLRTADDSTYANANRRRCTFWKDVNAALCNMPTIPRDTTYFEDCDIIYNRLRDPIGNNGGGFQLRDGGLGVVQGDMVIRNIRFLDKRSNMSAINFSGFTTSFHGVRFENVSIEPPINGRKQKIFGDETAPWFGGVTFKNVSFGGVALTEQNFDTYFDRNEWVDYLLFDDPANFTLTTVHDSAQGEIRRDVTQATYPEMTPVVLSAVTKYGDFVFSHWSGGATGSENPLTVWMTENKTITANFRAATINEPVIIKFPATGTWTVPAGVYSLTMDSWGAGGAGGSAYNGATSGANTQARGGAGAGGSFASRTFRVSPGQVMTYTVGAGGGAAEAGFIHNSNAGSGGTSSASVNGQSTTAVGGPGGKNISVSNQAVGGTSGTAPTTGNSGQVIFYGGNGGPSTSAGTGGGGGSAGSLGAGGHGSVVTAGLAGLGGGATGGAGHNDTNEGKPGGNPGAGGSGAGVRSSAYSHRTGGNGGDGQMIVTYNTMTFTLSTSTVGNGTIALDPAGGSYPSGTNIGVNAVTPLGYVFTGWSGALSGATNPTTVLMDDNKSITATFVFDPSAAGVWDGGGTADGLGDFNWSDAANWIAASPSGGDLTFAGTSGLTSSNNLAADITFTGITFDSTAGPFTLSGNRIALGGDVINNDADLQTLNLPMILSPTRTFDTASGNLAVGGILSGSGGFIKSGIGTLTLSAENTFSGTTAIQNGTIVLQGGNNRLPVTSAVTLGTVAPTSTIGVLQLGDSAGALHQTVTGITIPAGDSGPTNRVVGGHSTSSSLTINNITNVTFNGSFGGPGVNQNNLTLIKAGSGLLALRGTSTFTGPTIIQNGIVEIGNGDNRLPATTALTLGSGATSGVLQLGNTVTPRSQTVGSINISGTGTNNRVVGAHTTNGPPGFTVNNNTDVTYDGLLGGPTGGQNRLNLTKNGVGTLILSGASGANTYTGTTVVNNGILLINGNSPLTTGAVTVNGGALGGNGTIGGTVTVMAAGSLSPGASVGTFSTGGLNLSALANGGSGKLNFQLGSISTSDKIVVNGGLTIGPASPALGVLGFSDFTFSALSGLENGAYKLITGASSIVGGLDPVAANLTGQIESGPAQGTLRFAGNDLELLVTGVGPGPVEKFVISPISSLQTVGTAITGITITAQDAANNTATSFAGTVTFGGTGGFSGTSASFAAGILTGVSITPAVAGTNLTFTVDDGASHTGSTIVATIQTPYEAWSGGTLFDADANSDGVENGLAWLLGAASPTSSVNRPLVTQDSNGLVLTFSILNAASRGGASVLIEHSSDLGNSDLWTAVSIPETTNAVPDNGVAFAVTPGSQLNSVVARVSSSESAAGRLFGRLKGQNQP